MSSMLALLAASALAEPTTFAFDPAQSSVYVTVQRDESAMGSDLAHDHVVAAGVWSGAFQLDPDDLAACKVEIIVPVTGLVADQPELRRAVGYDVMLTDAQQAQVKEHMLGSSQLDASKYGSITFRAESCSGSLDALVVEASLQVHGTTKRFKPTVAVTLDEGTVRVKGSFQATHAELGFEPYSAFFGALRNADPLAFHFDAVGVAK